MGHEFSGRVVQTSPSSTLQLNQKVMIDPRINCKSCPQCTHGIGNLCSSWGFLGLHGTSGGFSEFAAVDAWMCYPLPESVNLDEAALIEPLCVARHALAVAGVGDFAGKTVLVLGGGPIGIAVLWNLRAVGVGMLIVSEPTVLRQEHTRDLASHVFNPMEVNVAEECRKLTDGVGVDVVFDCAGIPAGLSTGMDALRARGTYVNVAGWEKPVCSYSCLSQICRYASDSDRVVRAPDGTRHDEGNYGQGHFCVRR
jgi:threonine dehydrogenase-like Zn-dependent dehydrogenase